MSNEKSDEQIAFEASHPAVILERTTTLVSNKDKETKQYRYAFAGIVNGNENNFEEAKKVAVKLTKISPPSRGKRTIRDFVVAEPNDVKVWESFEDFNNRVVDQAQAEAREKQRATLRKLGAEGRKMFNLPDPDCSDDVLDKLIADNAA